MNATTWATAVVTRQRFSALAPRTLDKGPRTFGLRRSLSRREGFVRRRWSDTGAGASTFVVSIYTVRWPVCAYGQRSRYLKQVKFELLRSLVTSDISNFIDDVSTNVECSEESFKGLGIHLLIWVRCSTSLHELTSTNSKSDCKMLKRPGWS